jgi:hypothetical protein
MWIRGLLGAVCVVVGGVWIAQGTGALRGSMMTGHGQYTLLGAVVVVVGLALLGLALRARRRG